MRHENNHIDVDRADLTRKKSSPSILIGTARRVIIFILTLLVF